MPRCKRADIRFILNTSSDDDTNDATMAQSADQSSTQHKSTKPPSPSGGQKGQSSIPLPRPVRSKGKRQASTSPIIDSALPGLRHKRTKPDLNISSTAANSPITPSNTAQASAPLGTSSRNAVDLERASTGHGIEDLGGRLNASTDEMGAVGASTSDPNRDMEAEKQAKRPNGKMGGTRHGDNEPYDAIMASLEFGGADQPLDEPDLDSLTSPSSPVVTAQRQRPVQQPVVFSMGEAIMSQNDVLLMVCNYLGLKDFFNFYCVSKRFYVLVNSHYATHMRQLARNYAPLASTIFPYQLYKRACIRDPIHRTRPAHASDPPANIDCHQQVIRTLPGLRWVLMCAYREALVHDMLLCLALQGHRLPRQVPGAVLRVWALLDMPTNGARLAAVHDAKKRWPTPFVLMALMFFFKLDMRFADPILGSGECFLRRLLLGQRSLVVLWEALRGLTARTRAEVLPMLVRWDCQISPELMEAAESIGDGSDTSVFGVPAEEVGVLSREGWRQGGALLLRPDQLLLKEAVRRRLNVNRCFLDFMIWGYIDWLWVRDVELPNLKQLEEEDERRRSGGCTAEQRVKTAGRNVSSGSLREMMGAAGIGSN